MQQKLKVGILGAGHIAQKMATTLMGMKEAELYSPMNSTHKKPTETMRPWPMTRTST